MKHVTLVLGYKFNSMPVSVDDKVDYSPISMIYLGVDAGI